MDIRSLVDQTRRCWAEKPARDAEWELWANVPDLAHLRELVAWFCEGKLSFTHGHAGPREPETEGNVGDALAHANRSGFLTTNSQNGGESDYGRQWRSAVEGLADDATVAKLRALVVGTRLCIQAAPLRFFRQRGIVPNSHQKPDGSAYGPNPVLSWRDIAFQFSGIPDEVLSQVTRLNYVQIVDPKWGPSDLLWERLAEPDWDNPTPPKRDRAMTTWEERQSRTWGVINPDGTVTAKGRMDDPDADADQEVYPPGVLAWHCGDGWYCMATGRPAAEGPEPVRALSAEEVAHRQRIRETQRQHPGQLVCVLCAAVPCTCTRCPTCGMTEQAEYGGCPRGCGTPPEPPADPWHRADPRCGSCRRPEALHCDECGSCSASNHSTTCPLSLDDYDSSDPEYADIQQQQCDLESRQEAWDDHVDPWGVADDPPGSSSEASDMPPAAPPYQPAKPGTTSPARTAPTSTGATMSSADSGRGRWSATFNGRTVRTFEDPDEAARFESWLRATAPRPADDPPAPLRPAVPSPPPPPPQPQPPAAAESSTTSGWQARDRWNHTQTGRTINNAWDGFLAWLFKGWGFEDSTQWAPERPRTPQQIRAGVDAAVAARTHQASQEPPEPEPASEPDLRPEPQPQDLDNLTPPPAAQHSGAWSAQHFKVDLGPEWCNCGWMAGAHNHDHTPELNVGGFLSPPPSSGAAPATDPSNPN